MVLLLFIHLAGRDIFRISIRSYFTILLLDEATSNVDEKTDKLMQRVIRTEFTDSTIIAIAHRVHSLTEFGIIAVIDEGRIVEYGSPGKLLSRPESLFCRFYDIQRSATYEY